MSLFLPSRGYHVRLKKGHETYKTHPLGDDARTYDANLWIADEYSDQTILTHEFDPRKHTGNKEVVKIKAIWFITSEDPARWPDEPTGDQFDVCAGTTLAYDSLDEMMADMADVNESWGVLWGARQAGAEADRLVRVVFAGDLTALGPLADAVEEAGHANAKAVRQLANAEGGTKKKSRKKKTASDEE